MAASDDAAPIPPDALTLPATRVAVSERTSQFTFAPATRRVHAIGALHLTLGSAGALRREAHRPERAPERKASDLRADLARVAPGAPVTG
ncbi:MAG: hypothetical protein SGJ13_05305 [Actinomycetota bacterium]|nr:hypothetical protein [Actinomycetota bacterium]